MCTAFLALLAVADSHVRELFHRHCFTNFSNPNYGQLCVSSEHYLPSLLASYGLDNATDCQVRQPHSHGMTLCTLPNSSCVRIPRGCLKTLVRLHVHWFFYATPVSGHW
jgi:hypothetical protein